MTKFSEEDAMFFKKNMFKVLGVRLDAIQIPKAINLIKEFVKGSKTGYFIALIDSHQVMEGCKDPVFKAMLNSADLSLPDGMPLLWLAKKKGFLLKRRVYGPELMETFLSQTRGEYSHFFYGGKPKVTERLAQVLKQKYPELRISGFYSPPFKQLDEEEDAGIIDLINNAKPDILWVGLGVPKQEKWIYTHRQKIKVPVMIGVGAAFDFLSGSKPQAPSWMRESGLEWTFRLITEPKRLWYRYLVLGPKFVIYLMLEHLGMRKF
jgi:N-acetylglucosaminyldiphosphoundecaprenol N-acetyl-beta-D-mannosaminyltransferase